MCNIWLEKSKSIEKHRGTSNSEFLSRSPSIINSNKQNGNPKLDRSSRTTKFCLFNFNPCFSPKKLINFHFIPKHHSFLDPRTSPHTFQHICSVGLRALRSWKRRKKRVTHTHTATWHGNTFCGQLSDTIRNKHC